MSAPGKAQNVQSVKSELSKVKPAAPKETMVFADETLNTGTTINGRGRF